jgi:fermentation-respiration switch protein FrsA (DUF1100 family)
MLRKLLAASAALSAPGIVVTLLSERLIRPHLFYHEGWHPEPPDAVRWPCEEAQIFTADGLELQGWFFRQPQPSPTILFCHGTSYNASDMWLTEERAQAFHEFLAGTKCNFLVFDYRGYGRSTARTTEDGTYLDAAAAMAWLYERRDVDPNTIFLYGFSLGAAVATELALREPHAGLILRAPFTSMRDMIIDWDARFRLALALAPWLPITRYDNIAKIRRIDSPLLVMHGDADNTVPEWMGRALFDASPAQKKRYVAFPGRDHRDLSNDLVVPAVATFVEEVLSESREAERSGAA